MQNIHTHRITPTHWRRWKNWCREYYSFTFALKATRKAGATNYVNALTASRKCHPSFTTNTNNTLYTYTYTYITYYTRTLYLAKLVRIARVNTSRYDDTHKCVRVIYTIYYINGTHAKQTHTQARAMHDARYKFARLWWASSARTLRWPISDNNTHTRRHTHTADGRT